MNRERMELAYTLGAHDRRRVQSAIQDTAFKRRSRTILNLSHPLWMVAGMVFIVVILVRWLAHFLQRLWAGEVDFSSGSELFASTDSVP